MDITGVATGGKRLQGGGFCLPVTAPGDSKSQRQGGGAPGNNFFVSCDEHYSSKNALPVVDAFARATLDS